MTYRLPAGLLCSALVLSAADPALTIYNQNFAVVRDTVPLDLKPGVNRLRHTVLTARAEPDSVILRDPAGKIKVRIMGRNCLGDPGWLGNLLSFYEGKTIEFRLNDGKIVSGKIVRAGRAPLPGIPAMARQASMFANPAQPSYSNFAQPLIESEGKLRFDLPGVPLFPALASDAILKPTLDWLIRSDRAAKLDAELGYLSGGMNWKADYNIVASDESDMVQLIGWVTIANQSGKSFANARIALMDRDVDKLQPANVAVSGFAGNGMYGGGFVPGGPPVVEKTFDDYHLYTLQNPTTLPDRETKQVEFLRAGQVSTKRIYVYDGMQIDNRFQNWNYDNIRNNPEYGTQSNPKVWVMREFVNNEANHLGMPLPQGNIRFYRPDTTAQLA